MHITLVQVWPAAKGLRSCLPAPNTAPRIASAGGGRPNWRHTTAAASLLKLQPYSSEQTCMSLGTDSF